MAYCVLVGYVWYASIVLQEGPCSDMLNPVNNSQANQKYNSPAAVRLWAFIARASKIWNWTVKAIKPFCLCEGTIQTHREL